jgi:hypothetical protein
MPEVLKPKSNAEKLTKHRTGLATTLRRVDDGLKDLTATLVALRQQLPEKSCDTEKR